jgi:cell division protein FtsL
VEYAAPLQRSWDRMVSILFRPFEMTKWLSLGFTAWLAELTSGGGGSLDIPFDAAKEKTTQAASQAKAAVASFFAQYGMLIVALAVVLVLLILAVAVVVTWISSRGQFMFLDNVLLNRSEISDPWRRFRAQGNSLFVWRLVFGLIAGLAVVAVLAIGVVSVIPFFRNKEMLGLAIGGGVSAGLLLLALLVVLSYVGLFVHDFVVPIMRERQIGVLAGWSEFRRLFDRNLGFFVIYGLLKFALVAGIWGTFFTVLVVTCCGCCIGGLLVALPYVGTVLLLPIHVFFRAMGPEFLAELRAGDPGFVTDQQPPSPPDAGQIVVL